MEKQWVEFGMTIVAGCISGWFLIKFLESFWDKEGVE